MKPINEIDITKLKSVIEKLNDAAVLEVEISTESDDTEALVDVFVEEVSKIDPDREEEIPNEIAEYYNWLIADEVFDETEGEGQAEEKPKDKPKEDKPKKAKDTKPKDTKPKEKKKSNLPPQRAKNAFGHVIGTQADKIDEGLVVGGTLDEIAAKAGVKRYRVKAHAQHLINDRGVKVSTEGDIYKIV